MEKYKGISGWLLLLCLTLTVINPLKNILGYASSYRTMIAKSYYTVPGIHTFFMLNLCLLTIVIVFSVYAGIMLFKVRPSSVKIAKVFLLFESICSILFSMFPCLAGVPQELANSMMIVLLKNTAATLVWNAVWYIYINKSRRVATTYGNASAK
jgi:hypothetical protein